MSLARVLSVSSLVAVMPPSISPSSNPSSTPAQISATDKNPAMGVSPASTISHRPGPQNAFVRADTYISVDAYFKGPRNTSHHSKLPMFMRLYGSVIPRMIIPMLVLAGWSTLITCLCQFVYPLVVNTVLLTVLGLIVGLAISFRTSSGYERYIEGRKYWAQLSQAARDLGRHLWVHVRERADAGEATAKHDLLGKLTALNLIVAFAVALKHKLRFEPYAHYPDLEHRVRHLDSFAAAAYDAEAAGPTHVKRSWLKTVAGEYLDISFAESNPREALQRSTRNLGNLPLEVLLHLSAYVESLAADGTLAADGRQGLVMADLAVLNEVLAGTERILNTPLPLAYSIAISQITWIYCLALPFQLWQSLGWITIPGTVIG